MHTSRLYEEDNIQCYFSKEIENNFSKRPSESCKNTKTAKIISTRSMSSIPTNTQTKRRAKERLEFIRDNEF